MLTIHRHDLSFSAADRLICTCLDEQKPVLLLVPEQNTLIAESHMAATFPKAAAQGCEVTNFSRLANTLFRQVGGICYRYADGAAATLFLWRALSEVRPLLHRPPRSRLSVAVQDFQRILDELQLLHVGTDELDAAIKRLPKEDALAERLEDISLVRSTFTGELHEQFGLAAEDLDKLALLLKKQPFFDGVTFILDGFTSFTGQQMQILAELCRQADIHILLPLPTLPHRQSCFAELENTMQELRQLAEWVGCSFAQEQVMSEEKAPLFAFIQNTLFRADRALVNCPVPKEQAEGALALYSAEDVYAAAHFLAADIRRKVEQGSRYRDIAIVVRDTHSYCGILDEALREAGIPVFLAEREGIDNFAFVKMIHAAYAMLTRNFRQEDVMTYLKCRFSGISSSDIDLFELYTDRWRIHGSLFTRKDDWRMNPDGYTDRLTERGKQVLDTVNAVRAQLLRPFSPLFALLGGTHTAREHATALFEFLRTIRAEEQLCALAKSTKESGRAAEADKLARLYGAVLDGLDLAVEVMQDTPLSMEDFQELLSLLLSTVDLGQIPTSADEVTVGAADMLRLSKTPFVYLLGVNEGVFPAEVHETSAFNQEEQKKLQALGLPTATDLTIRASREEFCFLRAILTAKTKATLITLAENTAAEALRPSAVMQRLSRLCGLPILPLSQMPKWKTIFSPSTALGCYGSGDMALDDAIALTLTDDPTFTQLATKKAIPFSEGHCQISPSLAGTLFPKRLALTQSRLESYLDCPFAYYGKYVLHLNQDAPASFDALGIGNLMHALLEAFFHQVKERGISFGQLQKSELPGMVEQAAEAHLNAVCPDMALSSPRRAHLLARIKRVALLLGEELQEEFAQSSFSPVFAELAIGKEGAPSPVVFQTADGHQISLYGTIDRVDLFKNEQGETYLRVIDYKTGAKSFSLSDIAKGRNVQMLLYLLSVWKSRDPAFLQALGVTDPKNLFPAGMLYLAALPKDISLTAPEEPETVRQMARKTMTRTGLLLQDEQVLRAMDESLSGRFIPLKTNKSGEIVWNDSFYTLEKMGHITQQLELAVTSVGQRMCTGCADPSPVDPKQNHGRSPCTTCPLHPLCRSAKA